MTVTTKWQLKVSSLSNWLRDADSSENGKRQGRDFTSEADSLGFRVAKNNGASHIDPLAWKVKDEACCCSAAGLSFVYLWRQPFKDQKRQQVTFQILPKGLSYEPVLPSR